MSRPRVRSGRHRRPEVSQVRVRSGRHRRPEVVGALRPFRPDVQGLRAIAILLVVLYHARVPYITGGYAGVDVFFVISGFLITGGLFHQVTRHGRVSFRTFYAGRVRRLAAPAMVVIVVTLVAVRLWDSLFSVRPITVDALWAAGYAINYHLAAQGVNYQQVGVAASPLQHYWSLAVEEQFYLFWPALVAICVRFGGRGYRRLLLVVVVVGSGVSVWWCLTLTQSNQPLAYFSIQSRAWELGVGATLAIAADGLTRMPRWFSTVLSWAGLGAILVAGLGYTDATVFPGTAAFLPVAGAAAIVAAGCRPTRAGVEVLLRWRPFQGIGRVSYSWYLWHWPLLLIFPMKLGYSLSWPYLLEVSVVALWLAVFTLYLVELPSKRSRRSTGIWLAFAPGSAAVVVAVAVLVAWTVPSLVGTGRAVDVTATRATSVEHAVAVGTLTQAVPSNLTPAIASVRGDQPQSTLNGCHAGFLVVQQGPCVYGDLAGTHTMVLFGDSHAQQWLPGLDIEAKALGWRLVAWTKAACSIADVPIRAPQLGNREYTECEQWRGITAGKIAGLHPDVVVVAQSDSVPGNQFSNAQWADGTARSLRAMLSTGTPVVYVADTPVPRVNVPECVSNNLAKVEPCMFTRTEAYSFPGRHETMATTLRAAGVSAVDPVGWFCAPVKCPVVVGNILVYRDASHMSTPYSSYLAPATAGWFVPKA